jgi:hypothetical protein
MSFLTRDPPEASDQAFRLQTGLIRHHLHLGFDLKLNRVKVVKVHPTRQSLLHSVKNYIFLQHFID